MPMCFQKPERGLLHSPQSPCPLKGGTHVRSEKIRGTRRTVAAFAAGLLLAAVLFPVLSVPAAETDYVQADYGTDAENFSPVGERLVTWLDEVPQSKFLNGTLKAWRNLEKNGVLNACRIEAGNVLLKDGGTQHVPQTWCVKMYAIADKRGLYLAFDILDDLIVSGTSMSQADYLWIGFDFSRMIQTNCELHEEADATIPGYGIPLSAGYEEVSTDEEWSPWTGIEQVYCRTGVYSEGWVAQVFFPWDVLVRSCTSRDVPYAEVGDILEIPILVEIGNRTQKSGAPAFVAVTASQQTVENGLFLSGQYGDCGITLLLPCAGDMEFDSPLIQRGGGTESQTEQVTEEPTKDPTEEPWKTDGPAASEPWTSAEHSDWTFPPDMTQTLNWDVVGEWLSQHWNDMPTQDPGENRTKAPLFVRDPESSGCASALPSCVAATGLTALGGIALLQRKRGILRRAGRSNGQDAGTKV